MKTVYTLLLATLVCVGSGRAQNLVSITESEDVSKTLLEFAAATIDLPVNPQNGYTSYVVQYTMPGVGGAADTVSGLFIRPRADDGPNRYPLAIVQHGTTRNKFDVPSRKKPTADISNAAENLDLSHFYAIQGYATIAPDYLGMGDDEGFHPYVHARSEADAAIMMRAALQGQAVFDTIVNEQLFITGYSQGGHASMAAHEVLIEEYPEVTITAAAHLSGPYSISDIMRNEVILKDSTFVYLSFLPYTVLGYQTIYPELEQDLSVIFREPYLDAITRFRDGFETAEFGLPEFTRDLVDTLLAYNGGDVDGIYPYLMLTPEFEASVRAGTSPFVEVLRENDTYDFVNPTPTRLYYCEADDQVSFRNAIVAADTLQLLGATDTEAEDVTPEDMPDGANHGECIFPAVTASLEFFDQYAQIISGVPESLEADASWVIQGNVLRADLSQAGVYELRVFDALGRQVVSRAYRSGEVVDLSDVVRGFAAAQVSDQNGRTTVRSLVVR